MCFFLLELNWQLTLCSILPVSNHSSAGCSLHQMSPPHRGSSCTLHPGCAPCTLGSAGEVGWGSCLSVWGFIHCWLISQTHTHRRASPVSLSLSLSLSRTLKRHLRRQAEESGMATSGCCQAAVIWLDYQPGGNIQSHSLSSSLSSPAPSIYHLHAFKPLSFFLMYELLYCSF